jgi:L-alanine-DL-glutamate epimerase-like enolase superfamily enzyme
VTSTPEFVASTAARESSTLTERHFAALQAGEASQDKIISLTLSLAFLPLEQPISDAKVLTGRQRPMTQIAFLFAEITTAEGHQGVGYSYSKRAGGHGQYAHAKELAEEVIGEDPSDIQRIWTKLIWAGASVGRSGLATQAIAAIDIALWDLKAKRAGLPLAKLLGAYRDSVACYNTSGGFLSSSIEEIIENVHASVEQGIGGVKIKVGQPDPRIDLQRVETVRSALRDDVALMVDANQQWDRVTALRIGRQLEGFDLTWIEEPLDAYDAEGHAMLADKLDTPIATGEMLTSTAEHRALIERLLGGLHPARRCAGRRDHPVSENHDPRRGGGAQARAALRDGDSPAPFGRVRAGGLGRTLRLAAAAVQRAVTDRRRPDACAGPPWPGLLTQRSGPSTHH